MKVYICSGNGDCLHPPTEKYAVSCEYECTIQRCVNYVICGCEGPMRFVNYVNGCCLACNIDFERKLDFDQGTCCACGTTTICVNLTRCSHTMCITCFKARYYEKNPDPCPDFPNYASLYMEMLETPSADVSSLPMTQTFLTEWKEWYDKRIPESKLDICRSCATSSQSQQKWQLASEKCHHSTHAHET